MKDFKKLIREAHLGNPLNENKEPKQVNIAVVDGFGVYSVKVEFEDGSTEKFGSEEEASEKYNLDGVPRQEFEMDVSESVNEIDRATKVDMYLSGEEEYPEFDPEDVRADLEREMNEEMSGELKAKYDDAAMDEYGKPFAELDIAQKQELMRAIIKWTGKEFETDFERRRKGDYSDDRDDGMTDYQRRRMDENMGEWPKELTSRYSDEYRFELEKVMSDRAKYRVIDIESGELKGTPVFGKPESLMAYADDLIKPQGGTQSTNLGESLEEDMNDPVLIKTRAAQMKRDAIDKKDLENKSKRISADKAIDLRYELSILNKERENILMRIEDLGFETDQTAEPGGGKKADDVGKRMETAIKDLRDIDSKIIDIKDDLGIFDMNESVNEEKDYSKMHNVELNATYKKKFGVKDTKGLTRDELIKKLNDADLSEGNGGAKQDFTLNINNPGAESHALDDEVNDMGYSESLQESLRKKLQERLK